jgi:hypothetical protein
VNAKFFDQLGKLSEAMVEIPFAAARSMTAQNGQGGEQELQQAGWKAYDAWVRLMSESANSFYDSPELGASMGRSMEASLKWQRMGSAMAGAFFAALWPAVGLPTATELTELRAEVGAEDTQRPSERQAADALAAMWNGGWIPAAPFVAERDKDAPAN